MNALPQKEYASLYNLFTDLVNGNLTDAKKHAKKYTAFRLSMFARQIIGWSFDRSAKAAAYLKEIGDYQSYADAQ